MAFEKFKRMFRAANVYGETAKRMENSESRQADKSGKPASYTSAEQQDRMKAELKSARDRESDRINLSTYKPPRKVRPK